MRRVPKVQLQDISIISAVPSSFSVPFQDATKVILGFGVIAALQVPVADAVCHHIERQLAFGIGLPADGSGGGVSDSLMRP
jgi:hypothetical protein